MSQTYTPSEALASIKPTYITVYLTLQLAGMIFLTYLDSSPLILTYAVALMSMRYIMAKLTSKYGQNPSIGFHSEFVILVAVLNLIVTGMLLFVSGFSLTMLNLIGIFIFLTLFSNIGIFLEKWYAFLRGLRSKK